MKKELLLFLLIISVAGGGLFVYERFKDRKDFLSRLLPDAKQLERETGIKPAIVLSQAALESNWGNSELSLKHKNLFGLKVPRKQWADGKERPGIVLATKEEVAGTKIPVAQPFIVFSSYLDCMRYWAALLKTLYPYAYSAAKDGDIQDFAKGLKMGLAGAYATDSQYTPELLSFNKAVQNTGVV